MKDRKKNILGIVRCIIFVIITSLLFGIISQLLQPKNKDLVTGVPINSITAYRDIDKDTIDVLILGNSDAYKGINPLQIYNDTGITSYVLGMPSQTVSELYYKIKDFLKYQSPKLIVLETDCMFPDIAENENTDENISLVESIKKSIDDLGDKVDLVDTDIIARINAKYPLMKYKYSWKKLGPADLSKLKMTNNFISKGYVFTNKVVPLEDNNSDYMGIQDGKCAAFESDSKAYFDKIFNLCQKEDISIKLVSVPSANSWTYQKKNSIDNLMSNYDYDFGFVDFNDNINLIDGFSWDTDTSDGGNHLNYSGATKVTSAFELVLKNDYGITQSKLTDEQAQAWKEDLKNFNEKYVNAPKNKDKKKNIKKNNKNKKRNTNKKEAH